MWSKFQFRPAYLFLLVLAGALVIMFVRGCRSEQKQPPTYVPPPPPAKIKTRPSDRQTDADANLRELELNYPTDDTTH